MNTYRDSIYYDYLYSLNTKRLWVKQGFRITNQRGENMSKVAKTIHGEEELSRWNEGLQNHERLKKILPFLNEDEGYL